MKKHIYLLILNLLFTSCNRDRVVRINVSSGEFAYLYCPVEIALNTLLSHTSDTFTKAYPENYILLERSAGKVSEVPFQVYDNTLVFIMSGKTNAGITRSYMLKRKVPSSSPDKVDFLDAEGNLTFLTGEYGRVVYHKKETYPPEGVDTVFKRSAYLHPVTTPAGEVLTRINPPDHYHHYGLWNPWTKTHIRGREIDYWNLGKGEGTVRYLETEKAEDGAVFGSFHVKHQVIDKGNPTGERVSMEEQWKVKIWNTDPSGNRYALDLQSEFTNILEDTILFDAYRYGGGIGYRATEKWKADNCTVLTSEGHTRDEADGTRARWIMIEGEADTDKERAGILFLSHPANREHPEPVRVWPTRSSGGELMFDYCPIREKEWIIEPGKIYTLRYRMIVFDGSIDPEEAEMYWNAFAHPPRTSIF